MAQRKPFTGAADMPHGLGVSVADRSGLPAWEGDLGSVRVFSGEFPLALGFENGGGEQSCQHFWGCGLRNAKWVSVHRVGAGLGGVERVVEAGQQGAWGM